jgi:hypothetical protein
MPFDHILYIRNSEFAEEILASFRGTLLHELGHYTGANSTNIAGGHIVIDNNENRGAFVVHDSYRAQLEADVPRHKLTFAGACVLELYACDRTNIARCKIDVDHYLGRYESVTDIDDEVRISVMMKWRNDHIDLFSNNRKTIRNNYELCLTIMTEKIYLIDGFYVIPTSRLTPPYQRSDEDCIREEELVDTEAARRVALDQFISGINAGTINSVKNADPGKTSFISRFMKRFT